MNKNFQTPNVKSDLDKALRHQEAGRFDQAREIYQKTLSIEPDNADALHLLGVLRHQCGQHGPAIELISKAIQRKPENAAFHNNLGEVYRASGQVNEAARSYRRAVDLNPSYADACLSLANLMYLQGKLDEAVKYYHQLAKLHPQVAHGPFGLANVLVAQGKPDEAIESYNRALEIDPGLVEAHVNIGNTLKAQGELETAIRHYRRALEINPASPEALANLANALSDQGHVDEAMKAYNRALELNPDLVEARAALGQTMAAVGRLEQATLAYSSIQGADPNRRREDIRADRLSFAFPQNYDYNFKPFVTIEDFIDRSETERLIEATKNSKTIRGGLTEKNLLDNRIRQSSIRWVERNVDTYWIYGKMAELIIDVNKRVWNFDLAGFVDDFQYSEYGPDGHYTWHMDMRGVGGRLSRRKLSVTLQLSDPDEYEGGDLEFYYGHKGAVAAPRTFGTVIIFPSFVVHRISSITRGLRRSLVGWASGTHPFR